MDIPPLPATTARPISPTDVSQFIRLEQCERYLRLRLHGRSVNSGFMRDYGVVPQSIPPLLTRSGARFERTIEADLGAVASTLNLAETGKRREEDNAIVVAVARELAPGAVRFILQPRLAVEIGGWRIRGDIDILRLERAADGGLDVMIVDMKSSTSARVEHRLQVAFYHEMIAHLFAAHGVDYREIRLGVLYRGPVESEAGDDDAARAERAAQRALALQYFHTEQALLEVASDPASYVQAVHDLVTGADSTAARLAATAFDDVPYHLTYKCDGCVFNEFCLKWSAEHDDLSLLPHLTAPEKTALQRVGVKTVRELAGLKELRSEQVVTDGAAQDPVPEYVSGLAAVAGREDLVRRIATSWPVGPRLDELIHRARRYRKWRGDGIAALPYIPSKGYGSLSYCDAEQNPNLIRIYIDAQHDYLHDRIYMLGALVVAAEHGAGAPERRRTVVHITDGPPDSHDKEEQLFVCWIEDTLRAVVTVAAPDANGELIAPIHFIFFNAFEQKLLLQGLGRHGTSILGATPLYDFVTQLAAFDSAMATFLDQEIQELKNYPMVCQSLQAVAMYLKFDWNQPAPYRQIFRTRLFDSFGKFDEPPAPDASPWYTSRARFNSQIPLEYAYAAWRELLPPDAGQSDGSGLLSPAEPATPRRPDLASYAAATVELLTGFHARRLEAMERVAQDFSGNRQTQKSSFDLRAIAAFTGKAQSLAQALDEFVTIERHVELGAWKKARLAPPERRVLAGDTLLVRYEEDEQGPNIAAANRENVRRYDEREAWKRDHPDAKVPKDLNAGGEAKPGRLALALARGVSGRGLRRGRGAFAQLIARRCAPRGLAAH